MMKGTDRLGSDEPCPHCGAQSGVVPDGGRGHRCVLCGGPRIIVVPAVARPGGEAPVLAEAKALNMKRTGWGIGAGVATALAMIGGLLAIITASVFDLGVVGWVLLTAMALIPAFVAGFAFRRVRSLSEQVRRRLGRAEEIVAAEVATAEGELSASELAARMKVSEERAYELLAHAEVAGVLSSAPATERFRVAHTADDPADEPNPPAEVTDPGRARR